MGPTWGPSGADRAAMEGPMLAPWTLLSGMYYKAGTLLYDLWNAKHISIFAENDYLDWSEYTDFDILIDPAIDNLGYW